MECCQREVRQKTGIPCEHLVDVGGIHHSAIQCVMLFRAHQRSTDHHNLSANTYSTLVGTMQRVPHVNVHV